MTWICGASTTPPCGPAVRLRGRVKGAAEEPDDHALGLSCGGIGTKIHLVTDGAGLPLAFTLTPGQRHEIPAFEPTLKTVRLPGLRGRPRTRPKHPAGDEAYSYRPVFAYLRQRGIRPVIPARKGGNMGKAARVRSIQVVTAGATPSNAVWDG